MTIEILFPEICNLYGDSNNALYLKKVFGEDNIIETHLTDKPYFADHDVNLIYMGALAEFREKPVLKILLPLRERILQLIDAGVVFLITGNAMDIFGKTLHSNGEDIECLNIQPYEVFHDFNNRTNSTLLGEYNGQAIVGYKSNFSTTRNVNSTSFVKIIRGHGNDGQDLWEGFKINNFYCTYLIGPILVMNPLFAEEVLKAAGYEGELPLKEDLMASYQYRLKQFRTPGAHTDLNFHGV